MTLPVFDTSIHLSDLLIIGGGLIGLIKVGWAMRDGLRDVVTAVGGLRNQVDRIEGRQDEHHEARQRDAQDDDEDQA